MASLLLTENRTRWCSRSAIIITAVLLCMMPALAFQIAPYLQGATSSSVFISWHHSSTATPAVEYGTSPLLGMTQTGSAQQIGADRRWQTVRLAGLQSGTRYYYRAVSGAATSPIEHFTTLPDTAARGHFRFLIFSDTQEDSSWTGRLVRAAHSKLTELYGAEFQDSVQLIMHCGDAVHSGSTLDQYRDQLFTPFSPLSSRMPMMIAPGNHEFEHPYFYQYMQYDDVSAFPSGHAYFEKMFRFRAGRMLFVGLDSFLETEGNTTNGAQKNWFEQTLSAAEKDAGIDMVFTFLHHQPVSELWPAGAIPFSKNDVLGTMKKYEKPVQLTYGHVHAYEHGLATSERSSGDIHLVGAGGGGGDRDRWGEYGSVDLPEIHASYDHHFYLLIDVDMDRRSYTGRMFSLGNPSTSRNNAMFDHWTRSLTAVKPETPVAFPPTDSLGRMVFRSSTYAGTDSLMSVHFQVTPVPGDYSEPWLDQVISRRNIWGVNAQWDPVDKNAGVNPYRTTMTSWLFDTSSQYGWRTRHRNHNGVWSDWSAEQKFPTPTNIGVHGPTAPTDHQLLQNFPNPFNPSTTIRFSVGRTANITMTIRDIFGRDVATLVSERLAPGTYSRSWNAEGLASGIYFCRMESGPAVIVKKLLYLR
ncbi:MAG: metallophosphoesterase [Bacteroidetes bacterium]|nr:metallophosphoesterase [Bacteroidota bacterium]